ncbi:hypothetical protein, partial [Streptomyces otsuchiensis]|uniref:hypothetical protein n=1 Tax=Streptomyces otsuchiensis TaxID=2681388 RepID=UPI001D13163C
MADDEGATLLRLRVPGPVGEDPPPGVDDIPELRELSALEPPASMDVEPAGPGAAGPAQEVRADSGNSGANAEGGGESRAALSTVMLAGIAIAAVRGAFNAVSYLKAKAEHRRAVRDKAGKGGRDGADWSRAGKDRRMQSGPEFGAKNRGGGGAGVLRPEFRAGLHT